MKVYVILSHWSEIGSYEENRYKSVEAICATREAAEKYIASYDPNVAWEVEKNKENPWIKGEPRSLFETEEILCRFVREEYYGEEEEYFTITEMEVLE